jgi:hypothetical protein
MAYTTTTDEYWQPGTYNNITTAKLNKESLKNTISWFNTLFKADFKPKLSDMIVNLRTSNFSKQFTITKELLSTMKTDNACYEEGLETIMDKIKDDVEDILKEELKYD